MCLLKLLMGPGTNLTQILYIELQESHTTSRIDNALVLSTFIFNPDFMQNCLSKFKAAFKDFLYNPESI